MGPTNNIIFNQEFLPRTMGIEDRKVLAEIYGEFLKNLSDLLHLLESPQKSKNLYIEVHKLKGSSASVGAHLLSEKLAELGQELLVGEVTPKNSTVNSVLLIGNQTLDIINNHFEQLLSR